MPDDDTNAKLNSFDNEPSSSVSPHPQPTDLNHRLEADTHDTPTQPVSAPASESQPTVQPQPETPVVVAAPVAPVATPEAPVAAADGLPKPGPGLMVLQWLVYALWGWTVLALSGLVALVINQMFNEGSDDGLSWYGGGIAYLLAAVIVLYVISLLCDIFYARLEQKHARTTGTNVIMIIHAVIFALCGIGALIGAVFGMVQLLIGDTSSSRYDSDASGPLPNIISWLVIFGLYAITLTRTLRPKFFKNVAQVYWVVMTIIIIGSVIAGIIGPVARARLQAQDTVIEQGLPPLADAINAYANDNGALPKSLADVKAESSYDRESIDELLAANKVEYKPGEKIAERDDSFSARESGLDQLGGTVKSIYHYELCVEYATDDSNGRSSRIDMNDGDRYDTTISTYDHPKGSVCYDVQTDYS